MSTEQRPHQELRDEIEAIRQGPAYPDQPWHEFITFAEENAAAYPYFGPLFYRDVARVARYTRSLEEQLAAMERDRNEYHENNELLRERADGLKEQLEALGESFVRWYCSEVFDSETEAQEEWQLIIDAEREASSPAKERP